MDRGTNGSVPCSSAELVSCSLSSRHLTHGVGILKQMVSAVWHSALCIVLVQDLWHSAGNLLMLNCVNVEQCYPMLILSNGFSKGSHFFCKPLVAVC